MEAKTSCHAEKCRRLASMQQRAQLYSTSVLLTGALTLCERAIVVRPTKPQYQNIISNSNSNNASRRRTNSSQPRLRAYNIQQNENKPNLVKTSPVCEQHCETSATPCTASYTLTTRNGEANSASSPQRDAERVVTYGLRGEGLVRLTKAVVHVCMQATPGLQMSISTS